MSDSQIFVGSDDLNLGILGPSNPALYAGASIFAGSDTDETEASSANAKPKKPKRFIFEKRTETSLRLDRFDIDGKTPQQLIELYNSLPDAQKAEFLQQLAEENPDKLGQMYYAMPDANQRADLLRAIALKTPQGTFLKIYNTLIYNTLSGAQQEQRQFLLDVITVSYDKLTPQEKDAVSKIATDFFNNTLNEMPHDDRKAFLLRLVSNLLDIEKNVAGPEQKAEIQNFIKAADKAIADENFRSSFGNIENVMMIIIKVFCENMNIEGLDQISQINDTKIMNNFLDVAQQILKDNLSKQQDLVDNIGKGQNSKSWIFWVGIAVIATITVLTMGSGMAAAPAEALLEGAATTEAAEATAETAANSAITDAANEVVDNTVNEAVTNATRSMANGTLKQVAENAARQVAKQAAKEAAEESLQTTSYQEAKDAAVAEIKTLASTATKEEVQQAGKAAARNIIDQEAQTAANAAREAAQKAADNIVVEIKNEFSAQWASKGSALTDAEIKTIGETAVKNATSKGIFSSIVSGWRAKGWVERGIALGKPLMYGAGFGGMVWFPTCNSVGVGPRLPNAPMNAQDSANLGVYQSVSTLENNVVNQDTNVQQTTAKRMSDDSERMNMDYGFVNQAINLYGQTFTIRV